jgi:hypothetical protein
MAGKFCQELATLHCPNIFIYFLKAVKEWILLCLSPQLDLDPF